MKESIFKEYILSNMAHSYLKIDYCKVHPSIYKVRFNYFKYGFNKPIKNDSYCFYTESNDVQNVLLNDVENRIFNN